MQSCSIGEAVGLEGSSCRKMKTFEVRSRERLDLVEVTEQVQAYILDKGQGEGAVLVYIPHTTAAVTINENADSDVGRDLREDFDRLAPRRQTYYRHREGNSASHMLSSMMHSSVLIPYTDSHLALGTWQGIYLCEFDGPRTRRVHLQLLRI